MLRVLRSVAALMLIAVCAGAAIAVWRRVPEPSFGGADIVGLALLTACALPWLVGSWVWAPHCWRAVWLIVSHYAAQRGWQMRRARAQALAAERAIYGAPLTAEQQAEQQQRQIALALLQDAMVLAGRHADRLPGWRDLLRAADLGLIERRWHSDDWQRAVALLRPYLVTIQGGGGGTLLRPERPDLVTLAAEVASGLRLAPISAPPTLLQDGPDPLPDVL